MTVARYRPTVQPPVEALLTVQFNWATLLFYAFFIAYGFYGAHTTDSTPFGGVPVNAIGKSLLLAAILVLLGMAAWRWQDRFSDKFQLERRDFLVFTAYAVLLGSLSLPQLGHSLAGDEIAYSMASQGHALFISLALAPHLQEFAELPFRYLVQGVSLVLLVALSTLLWLTRRRGWKVTLIVLPLALVVGRTAFSLAGGNPSPHPPLNLLPLSFSGALLGVTDLSFKLAYFLLYATFLTALQRMLARRFEFSVAFFCAFAIGTVPLLWHMASVVEHSIWGAACFTLVLVELATREVPNFLRLSCLTALAVLMRQPAVLALIPVLALASEQQWRSGDRGRVGRWAALLLPLLVFAPFLVGSMVAGTPSTDVVASSGLTNIRSAIESGIVWTAVSNSLPPWWIVLIPFAFIPLERETVFRNIVFAIFFLTAICVYFSINPKLWGLPKYQAEYAIPFAIAGLVLLLRKANALGAPRLALVASLLVLSALNLTAFVRIPAVNKPVDVLAETIWDDSKRRDSGFRLLTTFPYNYRDAYLSIRNAGLEASSHSMGVTYGVFPEIMNDYSLGAIPGVHEIWLRQASLIRASGIAWTRGSADLVDSDQRIRAVLVGFVFPEKEALIDDFGRKGWVLMGEHRDERYGSTVVVLRRGKGSR